LAQRLAQPPTPGNKAQQVQDQLPLACSSTAPPTCSRWPGSPGWPG